MTTTVQRDHDRPGPYRVLGTRPLRHDGVDKVTGAARYGADIQISYHPQSGWFEDTPLKGGTEEGYPLKGGMRVHSS